MSQDDQDKTEQPTAKKLQKAREDGNVPKSQEISSVVLLSMSVGIITFTGKFMYSRFEMIFESFFQSAWLMTDNQEVAIQYLGLALFQGISVLAPLLVVLIAVAVLVNIVQTGGLMSSKILMPKGNRMNPQSGFKRIISVKGIVELVKGFSKIGIVGMVIFYTIKTDIQHITSFMILPLGQILSDSGEYIYEIIFKIMAALFLLSALDALYNRYQHIKDLRMTKQEVKDEYKEMDGDPYFKSKRKQKAMSLAKRKRLDHAVLASDVIVTNPTHYSVALHYDPDMNEAPIIRAKGMRNRALKIREFAKKYDIPMIENPPVARALYATAEEDQFVPETLYQAVAEILAYVYKMKNKKVA